MAKTANDNIDQNVLASLTELRNEASRSFDAAHNDLRAAMESGSKYAIEEASKEARWYSDQYHRFASAVEAVQQLIDANKARKAKKPVCKDCGSQPTYDWAVEICTDCLEAREEVAAE